MKAVDLGFCIFGVGKMSSYGFYFLSNVGDGIMYLEWEEVKYLRRSMMRKLL